MFQFRQLGVKVLGKWNINETVWDRQFTFLWFMFKLGFLLKSLEPFRNLYPSYTYQRNSKGTGFIWYFFFSNIFLEITILWCFVYFGTYVPVDFWKAAFFPQDKLYLTREANHFYYSWYSLCLSVLEAPSGKKNKNKVAP